MTLLIGRMAEPVDVEVGEDPQQGRPHVDPAVQAQVAEAAEAEKVLLSFHCP